MASVRGSNLLKFQRGELRADELLDVAQFILDPPTTQEHGLVAMLTSDSAEKRLEHCEALVIYTLSMLRPLKEPGDSLGFVQASIRFVRNCSPVSMVSWGEHIKVSRVGRTVESVRISPYLQTVIACAEDLWGVPGHLAPRAVKNE